ncbi:MFS transporter [Streptomyces sp. NPDC097610]|uniref:MFS transporter n=1 Tax=Streptomyces sp. NPDC097610 TaxID=3157227 RepID=UPI00331DE762
MGPLGDRIGRGRIFRLDLWMFVVFSVLCTLAWDPWSPAAFRFALGLAVGLDYPIAAGYLAEILPSKNRGRWLVGAFSLQAAGILLGAVVGVVVLNVRPEVDSWRIMLGFGVLPALLIIWLRRAVPESPRWLAQNEQSGRGRQQERRRILPPEVPADGVRRAEQVPSVLPHRVKRRVRTDVRAQRLPGQRDRTAVRGLLPKCGTRNGPPATDSSPSVGFDVWVHPPSEWVTFCDRELSADVGVSEPVKPRSATDRRHPANRLRRACPRSPPCEARCQPEASFKKARALRSTRTGTKSRTGRSLKAA